MAKIAVSAERGTARRRTYIGPGRVDPRVVAKGNGWTVDDVVCSCGPQDRPYDEQHDHVAIAIVISGT
ncbi:MAG: AraC family transcriptional regulator, partial [Acidobacteria bacterium]